jgi:hypothetical protein
MAKLRDLLTPAIDRVWRPAMRDHGFQRAGRRDFIRVCGGILHEFNFQISASGSRDFCVNVAAFSIAGNDMPVLQPGFRLAAPNGADVWLPSASADDAEKSAIAMLQLAIDQALPFFAENNGYQQHARCLRGQRWGSEHHRWFQIGVAEAGSAESARATEALKTAISYYIADGRAWCAVGIERAEALIRAIESDRHNGLLEQWYTQNSRIHRLH